MRKAEVKREVKNHIKEYDLSTNGRQAPKVYKRFYLYNYMFKHGFKYEEIGKLFNRGRLNVYYGVREFRNLCRDPKFIEYTEHERTLFPLRMSKGDSKIVLNLSRETIDKLDSYISSKNLQDYSEALTKIIGLIK